MGELVRVERPRDGVAALFLNRPERRNALNMPLRLALAAAIEAAAADAGVRCLVLAGDEVAFVSGADLVEMKALAVSDDVDSGLDGFRVAARALDACRKPVIAAVRGWALGGGCELALACDMVVAGEGAKFGQAEVKLGLMPGAGGIQRMLRLGGKQRAMRWLLTGDMMGAHDALALGLACEVVADADVLERAYDLAASIAAAPPLAVAAIKRRLKEGADEPLTEALEGDRQAFRRLIVSRDAREGVEAFLERRKPVFEGR